MSFLWKNTIRIIKQPIKALFTAGDAVYTLIENLITKDKDYRHMTTTKTNGDGIEQL